MSADRDIIDVTISTALDNPAEAHLAWVRDLIAHRAPEIGPADIADAYGVPTESDPDPGLSVEVVTLRGRHRRA